MRLDLQFRAGQPVFEAMGGISAETINRKPQAELQYYLRRVCFIIKAGTTWRPSVSL